MRFEVIETKRAKPLILQHHYSGRMPSVTTLACGLFSAHFDLEAAVLFGIPATQWKLPVLELTRLCRVPECSVPLTRLISFGISQVDKKRWPLAISYADCEQQHHGGIYQASGWHYHGFRKPCLDGLIVDGSFLHGRVAVHRWGTRSAAKLKTMFPDMDVQPHYDAGKHLYWKPLCVAGKTRAKLLGLKAQPYPKPNAARPLDERSPERQSAVQPCGAAPIFTLEHA